MDAPSPDWDLAATPGGPPNHAGAHFAPPSPAKMQSPAVRDACPDHGLIEACKTLKQFFLLTAGLYSVDITVHRAARWPARPHPALDARHTAHALLQSMLDPRPDSVQHNLRLFARCIAVIGYEAPTVVVVSSAAPHTKSVWTVVPPANPGFMDYNLEKTDKPRNAAYPLPAINTTVTVFVNPPPAPAQRTQGDTVSYVLTASAPAPAAGRPGAAPGAQAAHPAVFLQQSQLQTQLQPQLQSQLQLQQDHQLQQLQPAGPTSAQPLPPLRQQPLVLPPLSQIGPAVPTSHPVDLTDFPGHPTHAEFAHPSPGASAAPSAPAVPFWSQAGAAPGVLQHELLGGVSPSLPAGQPRARVGAPAGAAAGAYAAAARGTPARRKCSNCGTVTTRQWVRGENNCWLCHSCGQFWRKNGYARPASLWNRPTFKRSRRKNTVAGGRGRAQPPVAALHALTRKSGPPAAGGTAPGAEPPDTGQPGQARLPTPGAGSDRFVSAPASVQLPGLALRPPRET